MSDVTVFTCELRQRSGTGGSRAVRRDGWVPAILYGGDQEPANIKLRYNEVLKAYNTGRLISVLSKINVDGEEQSVIGRDIQVDPVKDFPLHVDLMRVSEKTRINVDVPMAFHNEEASPGLKRGGVLNVVRHTVEVIAPATRIPETLDADLTGLDIGDAVHISSINMPEGVHPTITDRDFTIATIAAPSVVRSTENEDADAEGDDDTADGGEEGDNE